jgi:hypothetical protein
MRPSCSVLSIESISVLRVPMQDLLLYIMRWICLSMGYLDDRTNCDTAHPIFAVPRNQVMSYFATQGIHIVARRLLVDASFCMDAAVR